MHGRNDDDDDDDDSNDDDDDDAHIYFFQSIWVSSEGLRKALALKFAFGGDRPY